MSISDIENKLFIIHYPCPWGFILASSTPVLKNKTSEAKQKLLSWATVPKGGCLYTLYIVEASLTLLF